jgi:hypothetical protein
MSEGELDRLEREVEEARGRVRSGLTRLETPGSFSTLKRELTSDLLISKQEIVEAAKETTSDYVQSVLSDVKARVAANPTAALAIGAGLAWHLTRHPPITSVLLGYGIVSLFRTDPKQPPFTTVAAERASAMSRATKEAIGQTSERAAERLGEVAAAGRDRISEWSAEAADAAHNAVSQTLETAEAARESGMDAVSRFAESENRDKYLLGAAALALAAAAGIAYQRRATPDDE